LPVRTHDMCNADPRTVQLRLQGRRAKIAETTRPTVRE
jgi:hypothetical protein